MRLNKNQIKASIADFGVNIVLAGAGAGKTKTLVEKVVNIIRQTDVLPENILILTFSRKAAEEIKSRIIINAGGFADKIISGTFHSFCLYLLKNYGDSFMEISGYSIFPEIIDDQQSEKILNDIIKNNKEKLNGLPFNMIYGFIQSRKFLKKHTVNKLESTGILNEIDNIITGYGTIKKEKALIDFDDMMQMAILLLGKYSEIRNDIQKRFSYVFVDEFQDTSEDNFRLLKMILSDNPNLFAVGDDFQSIYGFRGSSMNYIINPGRYFSGTRKHVLGINYRSKKEIVALAEKFIRKNKNRSSKKLKSAKGSGSVIKAEFVRDMDEEALYIDRLLNSIDSRNIAVLYRNNFQGELLKQKLCIDESRVQLMTMHASKGLEFETVIIAGLSDKIIPDRSSDLEEERRLLYVAITRAEINLYLIFYLKDDNDYPFFAKELGFSK